MSRKRTRRIGRGGGITNQAARRRIEFREPWPEPERFPFKNPVAKRCRNGDLGLHYPCRCVVFCIKADRYDRFVANPCRDHRFSPEKDDLLAAARRSREALAGRVL